MHTFKARKRARIPCTMQAHTYTIYNAIKVKLLILVILTDWHYIIKKCLNYMLHDVMISIRCGEFQMMLYELILKTVHP